VELVLTIAGLDAETEPVNVFPTAMENTADLTDAGEPVENAKMEPSAKETTNHILDSVTSFVYSMPE
jgi:hypothetical protein